MCCGFVKFRHSKIMKTKVLVVVALAFVALSLHFRSEAGLITIEDDSFLAVKTLLIAQGYSEIRANCFIIALKYTAGTAGERKLGMRSEDMTLSAGEYFSDHKH
ncbi:hypothetical protein Bhyg_02661 [Pseudolycoriella hygida]|uniref:Uncharacterized protein n=1 Tax=Pseudolycoriella hygida TaxID=35572 RepID=A0A9Q0S6V1_9DIPT|nr:hypothetical protein Bhyg_02661 [Pseudolycoriella hygida]